MHLKTRRPSFQASNCPNRRLSIKSARCAISTGIDCYKFSSDSICRLSKVKVSKEGQAAAISYVEENPLSFIDPEGLAKSGIPTKVGNNTVRIDKPHVPGQQTHAHVDPKGGNGAAVNKDGTGSHGATPEDVQKLPNKVKDYLRNKGFNLCPPVPLLICPLCNILMPQPQGLD